MDRRTLDIAQDHSLIRSAAKQGQSILITDEQAVAQFPGADDFSLALTTQVESANRPKA